MVPDDARLVRHHTGMDWAEGPVYFAEGDYLLWSDIPNDQILRYSDADGVSVFRHPCGYTNGHYRDLDGRQERDSRFTTSVSGQWFPTTPG